MDEKNNQNKNAIVRIILLIVFTAVSAVSCYNIVAWVMSLFP